MKALLTKEQIVTFLLPYIDLGSGLLAAWLFVHVHILGVFHVAQGSVAQVVASGIVLAVTSGLAWAVHHFHWLPIAKLALASSETPPGSAVHPMHVPPGPLPR